MAMSHVTQKYIFSTAGACRFFIGIIKENPADEEVYQTNYNITTVIY